MLGSMELDPDELPHPGEEDLDWSEDMAGMKPKGQYNKLTDAARQMISTERACALFCGGKKCKYCSSEGWAEEEMVISGLYSHWVTDNILAMARPSNQGVKKYKLIDKFLELGITSIVNLQIAGEHADCGPHKLDPSGFLYNPQTFMEKSIFFYNFGWPDYGVASLSTILDMVKVMQFAVSQGKVAVHCHAGRGRTGVIIACYLVFTNRISGVDAIHYVREKRPGSIQTRQQMQVIQEFEKYLKPFRIVFAFREQGSHEFTLQQYLNRQRHVLHGYEARRLKYIPKVIYVICERLLELAQKGSSLSGQKNQRDSPNLEKTFSHLSTNDSLVSSSTKKALPLSSSIESLESIGQENGKKKHRKMKIFSNTRSRFRSISLEDLQNDEFKGVLKHPEADTQSQDSGSSNKTPVENSVDDDEDDDKSIVFGNSCVDLKSEANSGSSSSNGQRESKVLVHKTSTMSEWSIDGSIAGEMSEQLVAVVADALSMDFIEPEAREKASMYEANLNEADLAWKTLASENDPHVLSLIMWDWLDQLKEPILTVQDLYSILKFIDDPITGLQKVEKGTRYTIEYLVKVISKLQPLDHMTFVSIYEKLLSHLTHQWVTYEDVDVTQSWAMSTRSSVYETEEKDHWGEMKGNTANKFFKFFFQLKDVLEKKRELKKSLSADRQ